MGEKPLARSGIQILAIARSQQGDPHPAPAAIGFTTFAAGFESLRRLHSLRPAPGGSCSPVSTLADIPVTMRSLRNLGAATASRGPPPRRRST